MSKPTDVDQLLDRFIAHGLPGCGLKVIQNGEVLYEGYRGLSNLESGESVTRKSIFRLASMSKIPLYTTMMMLYERGAFLMTDPISNWLPEWQHMKKFIRDANGYIHIVDAQRPITVRDVCSMKCGLPYCNSSEETDNAVLTSMQNCMKPLWEKGHYTNREHVRAMSGAVLACEPGEKWIYGFSSELACALIEAICDSPIDDVFQKFLFDPLEMNDTRSRFEKDHQSRMVRLYKKKDDGLEPFDNSFFDDKHLPGTKHEQGWARLYSTVEDFSHLIQMLAEGGRYKKQRFLSPTTIDMMRTNGLSKEQLIDYTNTYERGYGYGYGVRTLIDKAASDHNGAIGSFGWTGGFGTWCEADPIDKVSIVYMHNLVPDDELYYHPRVRCISYGLIH